MKPIHECAVIKNGKELVGAMVAKTDSFTPQDMVLKRWEAVSFSDFEKMVANEQVQFFAFENGKVVCNYSEEEKKEMKKLGKFLNSTKFFESTKENYFDMDVVFQKSHVDAANRKEGIACCLAGVQKILGIPMVTTFLYGDISICVSMLSELERGMGKPGALEGMLKMDKNGNVGQLSLPLSTFEHLLDNLAVKHKMMFDTSTIRFLEEHGVKVPRIPVLMGKVDAKTVLGLADRLDRITAENERMINLRKSFKEAWDKEAELKECSFDGPEAKRMVYYEGKPEEQAEGMFLGTEPDCNEGSLEMEQER